MDINEVNYFFSLRKEDRKRIERMFLLNPIIQTEEYEVIWLEK